MSDNVREPGWFLVTSIGRTATYWLSWSLNRHPDILCSHGRHYPPTIYTLHDDDRASFSLSDIGTPIGSIYDIPPNEKSGVDDRAAHQRQQAFNSTSVAAFLDAHRDFGDFALMGNVHGYILGELIYRLQAGEAGREFALVNLVRNPVSQTLSFNRRHLFDARRDETYRNARLKLLDRRPEIVEAIRTRFAVGLDDLEAQIFLSTVFDLANMQQDICIETALHVPYELLTTSQDAFKKVLEILAGDRAIGADQAYLDEVFSSGPMNYSAQQATPADEEFAALEPWQQDAIGAVLSEEVVRRYTAIGYKLDFLS